MGVKTIAATKHHRLPGLTEIISFFKCVTSHKLRICLGIFKEKGTESTVALFKIPSILPTLFSERLVYHFKI